MFACYIPAISPVCMICQLISSCNKVTTVTDYFAALKRIQEELHVLLPISSDVKKIQQQRKQLVLRKFLARLKSELESVRSQILGCAELPALAEVYS